MPEIPLILTSFSPAQLLAIEAVKEAMLQHFMAVGNHPDHVFVSPRLFAQLLGKDFEQLKKEKHEEVWTVEEKAHDSKNWSDCFARYGMCLSADVWGYVKISGVPAMPVDNLKNLSAVALAR